MGNQTKVEQFFKYVWELESRAPVANSEQMPVITANWLMVARWLVEHNINAYVSKNYVHPTSRDWKRE